MEVTAQSQSLFHFFLTLIELIGLIFTVRSPHKAAVAAQNQYYSVQSVQSVSKIIWLVFMTEQLRLEDGLRKRPLRPSAGRFPGQQYYRTYL